MKTYAIGCDFGKGRVVEMRVSVSEGFNHDDDIIKRNVGRAFSNLVSNWSETLEFSATVTVEESK